VLGRVIGGRYRLESLLGRGGAGTVWRAVHVDLRTKAAIKILHQADDAGPESLTRFQREARAAASLRCSNVVQILDYGVEEGTPYIAMELLEGESLAARMMRLGRLSPEETARIVSQVARAVDQAHSQGIVHRDLKPDNIFLARDGGEEIVKVLDFGIAKTKRSKSIEDDLSTQTGAVLGTPLYMSLEQVLGDKTVDHRTDVWALAVIACECLAGKRPFVAETFGNLVLLLSSGTPPVPSRLAPVPVGFDAWFSRCTARQPRERYASIKVAASDLAKLVARGELTTSPGPELPSVGDPTQFSSASTVSAEDSGELLDPSGHRRRSTSAHRGNRRVGIVVGATLAAAGLSVYGWSRASAVADSEQRPEVGHGSASELPVRPSLREPDDAPPPVDTARQEVVEQTGEHERGSVPASEGGSSAPARRPPLKRAGKQMARVQAVRAESIEPPSAKHETPSIENDAPPEQGAENQRELLERRVGF
jgi:serine/threonine-protein kinase